MSFANRQVSHDDLEGLIVAEPPGAQPTLNDEPSTIGGGAVRNHLSTALVKLYREIFGRGPVKTTTYAFEAGYVTFLRDLLVPHERALVLAGRPVLHDSFQFQPERNLAIELFWVPTGCADGAGNTPAPQAIAPTDARYRGGI